MKDAGLYRAKLRRAERVQMEAAYKRIGMERKADRIAMCGSELSRTSCPDGGADHYEAIRYSSRCHLRLCPSCAEMAASIAGNQLNDAIVHIGKDGKKHTYIMVTVTVRNCAYDKLDETIGLIMSGWVRMKDRAWWKRNVLGAVRNIEITRNEKTKTFHPHMHMLLEVSTAYWHEGYKSQNDWKEYWQSAAGLDYEPIVDVRRVGGERNEYDMQRSIRYVSKYCVKLNAMMDGVADGEYDEILAALEAGIGGRRLRACTGSIAKARKELGQAEPEEMEDSEIPVLEICPECGKPLVTEIYRAKGTTYCYKRTVGEAEIKLKYMPPPPIGLKVAITAASAAPAGGTQRA